MEIGHVDVHQMSGNRARRSDGKPRIICRCKPRVVSRVVGMDPLRFLAGCCKRATKACSVYLRLSIVILNCCCLLGPLFIYF